MDTEADGDKIVPIRAISRGLSVLAAINRHGSLTMMEIARHAGVPYPTACRILQTLLHSGYVERFRNQYRPTLLVRTLSSGYNESEGMVAACHGPLMDLGTKTLWPVAFCTRVGVSMMVRYSTHMYSPLTYNNYYPGYTLPILECASGKSYLAFCAPDERAVLFKGLEELGLLASGSSGKQADPDRELALVRERGFSSQLRSRHNATPGKTSSIAVPVLKDGVAIGAVGLTFFASALSIAKAAELFVEPMKATAETIAANVSQIDLFPRGTSLNSAP